MVASLANQTGKSLKSASFKCSFSSIGLSVLLSPASTFESIPYSDHQPFISHHSSSYSGTTVG